MTTNIQIIPTLYCNMSCDGCYLSANNQKLFIKPNDYKQICNFIYNYNYNFLKINKDIAKNKQLEISLLGGEVTSVYSCKDILNIKHIIYNELQKNFPNIVFGIQTNLIMNKKKIDCLLKNNIKIGTSFNFDTTRKYKNSLYKYYKKFFDNYNYIIDNYNQKLGIIIVINKNNISFIENIIKHLLKNNFFLVLSPFEELGNGISYSLVVPNNILSNLYINLFEFIYKFNIKTDIQPLKNFLLVFNNQFAKNSICGFENYCHKKSISFFFDNNVYVCPEYQATLFNNIKIGNWKTNQIFLDNIKNNIFKSYILPEKCKNCKFLSYCYGICPAKRLKNFSNPPYYCETYFNIFNYLDNLKKSDYTKFTSLLNLFNI